MKTFLRRLLCAVGIHQYGPARKLKVTGVYVQVCKHCQYPRFI